jgi:hypothetical protein
MMQHSYALQQNYMNFEVQEILFLKFVLRDVIAYLLFGCFEFDFHNDLV